MLVLTRRIGERILIGEDIEIVVVRIDGEKRAAIGIKAPPEVSIRRSDVPPFKLDESED